MSAAHSDSVPEDNFSQFDSRDSEVIISDGLGTQPSGRSARDCCNPLWPNASAWTDSKSP